MQNLIIKIYLLPPVLSLRVDKDLNEGKAQSKENHKALFAFCCVFPFLLYEQRGSYRREQLRAIMSKGLIVHKTPWSSDNGLHDVTCGSFKRFVCSLRICVDSDKDNSTSTTNIVTTNSSSNNNSITTKKDSMEEVPTIRFFVFVAMVCFAVALTLVGLFYMIKTNCKCKCKCCFIFKDMEKGDKNMDYTTFYYDDGELRNNVIWR